MLLSSNSSFAGYGNFDNWSSVYTYLPILPPSLHSPVNRRLAVFCHTHFSVLPHQPTPVHWSLDLKIFATPILTYDVWNCPFSAYWLLTLQLAVNQFSLAGWEISCWQKGADKHNRKTSENSIITFILINWGVIINFSTNWSFGAPGYSLRWYLPIYCSVEEIQISWYL